MHPIDAREADEETGESRLPFAGIEVVHVPGHRAGQIALRWPRHGGVLLAADTAMNMAPWGLPSCTRISRRGLGVWAACLGSCFRLLFLATAARS
jgi:glyoxylase-like metal-dependent hydrolase (beta-lactamase superfamily II)